MTTTHFQLFPLHSINVNHMNVLLLKIYLCSIGQTYLFNVYTPCFIPQEDSIFQVSLILNLHTNLFSVNIHKCQVLKPKDLHAIYGQIYSYPSWQVKLNVSEKHKGDRKTVTININCGFNVNTSVFESLYCPTMC